jgi:hypothetical protein
MAFRAILDQEENRLGLIGPLLEQLRAELG